MKRECCERCDLLASFTPNESIMYFGLLLKSNQEKGATLKRQREEALTDVASGEQIERQISWRATEPAVIAASRLGCLGCRAHRSFSRCCQVIHTCHQS